MKLGPRASHFTYPTRRSEKWLRRQLVRSARGRDFLAEKIRLEYPPRPWDSSTRELVPHTENHIAAPALWVWELYSPSQVPALEVWLKTLGKNPRLAFRDRDIAAVLSTRRSVGSWNQSALPTLLSEGMAARVLAVSDTIQMSLPPGVAMAHPTVHVLPGGLTVLTVGFAYEEAAQAELDEVLRASRKSRITPSASGGHRVEPVETVQREDVEAFFRKRVDQAHRWIKDIAPGALTTYAAASDIRAARLVAYQDDIHNKGEPDPTPSWVRSLELDSWSQWCSTTMPIVAAPVRGFGVQFSGVDEEIRTEPRPLPGQPPRIYEWVSQIGELNVRMTEILLALAVDNLVDVYGSGLAELRDLPTYDDDSPAKVFGQLRALRQEIQILVDVRATFSALAKGEATDRRWLMSYDGGRWLAARNSGRELFDQWLHDLPGRAQQLLDLEEQVRERLLLESDLLSTRASVRSQRRAFRVAILALTVGFSGLGLAIYSEAHDSPAPSQTVQSDGLHTP